MENRAPRKKPGQQMSEQQMSERQMSEQQMSEQIISEQVMSKSTDGLFGQRFCRTGRVLT